MVYNCTRLFRLCVNKMVKYINLIFASIFACHSTMGENFLKPEIDFISDYKLVCTKITEKKKTRLKISLLSLEETVIFSLLLFNADKRSIFSPELTSFKVENSSGSYEIPNTIIYYHGHVNSIDNDSYVHGTLYHDLAFEGVIGFRNETFYLEAVDRHKPWRRDISILYATDNVAQFTKNFTNFPDTVSATTGNRMPNFDFFNLYKRASLPARMANKHMRKKRATREVKYCNLHIIVDGYFTHYMANGDKVEAAKMLAQSVTRAHEIFVSSDFDGNLLPDNVGVVLAGLTFIEKIAGFDYLKSVNDPVPFLNHFTSNYRFPGVCSAMAFTFQDFGPTLGMAWVAQSSRPARTGIGSQKNHGFVTTLLQGKRVPARMIHLTLVHELGHSFGSVHDPITSGHQCAPSDAQGGKYIMYPTSSEGTMPNNFIFSPCSKNVIAIIVGIRALQVLKSWQAPYCGNGHVEEGEECDCGTALSCTSLDQCCTPAGQENECFLRRDLSAVCTPAIHSCCTSDCQVIKAEAQQRCGMEEECMEPTYCDGEHFMCPQAIPMNNSMLCQSRSRVCESGHCTKSVCELADLDNCHCLSTSEKCRLCCINSSSIFPVCQPAMAYPWFSKHNIQVAEWMEPGSACGNNISGYCNGDYVCIQPGLAYFGFTGLSIFSQATKNWFDQYWYAVMVVTFLLVALLIIYLCTQHEMEGNSYIFRTGHIARVLHECKREHRVLNEQITQLNTTTHMFERGQQNVLTGLTRLLLLFPLTPVEYLHKVMTRSANEATAVKKLILMNQPMLAESLMSKAIKPQVTNPQTHGKHNELYQGKLFATVEDLIRLSKKERAALGITDPSRKRALKMLENHEGELTKEVANLFNKPIGQ